MSRRLDDFAELKQDEHWDVSEMTREELYSSFQTINSKMKIIYQFVLGYNDYINMGHNYTSELSLTMLEVHLLTDICDNENSTVTSLAEAWGRSMSATSQTVRRLMNKGLVVRENAPGNGKMFYLKATPKGLEVSDEHKRYDVEDTIKTVKRLLETLDYEEIDTMFKALERYGALLKNGPRKK